MKWIKASERLPEKYGIYYVRVLNSGLSTPDTSCFIFDEGFIVNHIGDEVTEWLDESPESKEPLKELKQNCQDAIDYIKDMEDDFQQGCKTAYSVVVDWISELSTENNKSKQL